MGTRCCGLANDFESKPVGLNRKPQSSNAGVIRPTVVRYTCETIGRDEDQIRKKFSKDNMRTEKE